MGNSGGASAKRAHFGTTARCAAAWFPSIVLATMLAGCDEAKREATPDEPDAGETPDGGLAQCTDEQPLEIGACARVVKPMGGPPISFAGVVESVTRPASLDCGTLGRVPSSNANQQGYLITVRNGEAELKVSVYLPWRKAVVEVGDRVAVEYSSASYIESPTTGELQLRSEDGTLLLWYVAGYGFDGPSVPELEVNDGNAQCTLELGPSCEDGSRRSLIAENGDSGGVEIAYGASADVGDYVVANGGNTVYGPSWDNSDCSGHGGMVVVAAARGSKASLNDGELSCNELTSADVCDRTDGCRAITAYDVDELEGAPRFVTCIVDDTCGDGDVPTCATNDQTDELALFTTTCVPPGWSKADGTLCDEDRDDDAGAP